MDSEETREGTKQEEPKEPKEPTFREKMKSLQELDPKLDVDAMEAAKSRFGKIWATVFGRKVFIIRAVTRIEFTSMMTGLQINENALPHEISEMVEGKLASLALLHPRIEQVEYSQLPAGTLSSLKIAIDAASDFLTPDQILMNTQEL